LIESFDAPDSIALALIREVRAVKATPFVNLHQARITREMNRGASDEQFEVIGKNTLAQMAGVDCYIAIRGSHNINELCDVPADKMKLVASKMRPTLNYRVNKTRWCVLRWPTTAMAQQAMMSTEAFEDFYFRVCTLDYSRMTPGMAALKKLMDRTDRVRIKGPETDLSFSIKDIGAVACGGLRNIPDGECFTAPVRESVEGTLRYNCASVYQGVNFDQIKFRFEKGRIVEASCNGDNRRLNAILDADPGARYIGEFAIGFNPHILKPMRDTLFDEKIAGSFLFTPGNAYDSAGGNGNRSQIHWDIVCIQRPEHGGGEIWFDDVLIRKNGRFVPKSLQKLNPEYLMGKR
jgi:aminopeptidase